MTSDITADRGRVLVLDLGTSGVRAVLVDEDATFVDERSAEFLPDVPFDGLVEFDALRYTDLVIGLAADLLRVHGRADAIGITNQRCSTIVWDRGTGVPVAPAQSWQDLRTLGDCLALQQHGLFVAPNQPVTKAANIIATADPDRSRDLCVGTPDSYLLWRLTEGAVHGTDASNAAISGMVDASAEAWDPRVLEVVGLDASTLPVILDSSGRLGVATAFGSFGAPADIEICAMAGDQQSSLVGQGAVLPGSAKITFGTGGMLDVCLGRHRPIDAARSTAGTFPIVCWRRGGETVWGIEAIMLSAGTNVQWLRDDLGLIDDAAHSAVIAARCAGTEGCPMSRPNSAWARRTGTTALAALVGLTRGPGVNTWSGQYSKGSPTAGRPARRGRTRCRVFDRPAPGRRRDDRQRRLHPGPRGCDRTARRDQSRPRATALGAALLAGLEIGLWSDWDAVAATWEPRRVVDPHPGFDRSTARRSWARGRRRQGLVSRTDRTRLLSPEAGPQRGEYR
ncbi:MAG: FGGY family carbohydrate kinase [Microthrixaceae bacterium]